MSIPLVLALGKDSDSETRPRIDPIEKLCKNNCACELHIFNWFCLKIILISFCFMYLKISLYFLIFISFLITQNAILLTSFSEKEEEDAHFPSSRYYEDPISSLRTQVLVANVLCVCGLVLFVFVCFFVLDCNRIYDTIFVSCLCIKL